MFLLYINRFLNADISCEIAYKVDTVVRWDRSVFVCCLLGASVCTVLICHIDQKHAG